MKVGGIALSGPRVVELVIPYNDDFAVFKFRPLTSRDDFEKVLTRPLPPKSVRPGGQEFSNFDDPGYQSRVEAWATKKVNWDFLQSVSVTEGLEWSTVKMDDPETWDNWRTDIEEVFGSTAAVRLFEKFIEVNVLDESKLEEARKRFLAFRAAQP